MSEAKRALPARPSLVQLRKQAKELARDADVPLARAQLDLARDYGFASWPKLVQHVETVNPSGLGVYEQLAAAVAAAYTAGDAEAVRELNREHGTWLVHDREPAAMQARLPSWFASATREPDLALADARELVARATGFDTWAELVRSLAPARGAAPAPPPEFYRIDVATGTLEVRGHLADVHWDTVLGVIAERGLTGLAAGSITDGELERVTRAAGALTRLRLGGPLTDDGLQHLASLSSLEDLELGCRGLTDRGLGVLRRLPRLKRFQMCWARVTDAGAANLTFCNELEDVDLMGTPTGDGTINALTYKKRLRRFKTGMLVTDAGLKLLPRFPALAAPQPGEPEHDLMAFDARPTHLMLDGPFTNAGLADLAGLGGLVGLSFFWHVTRLTSDGLGALAALPSLSFLGCQGALCDDTAMRHIGALPRLKMLMGQGAVATDSGFAALARSATLENFWGRDCPSFGSVAFKALAAMPALRGLAVSLKRVDDAALAALPTFPALRALMPMDVSDADFRYVGACAKLERLWCMYCRDTGDAATEHLRSLERLRTYYAGSTQITDKSLEVLAALPTLEDIELWDVKRVTNDGVAALARLPRLAKLAIEGSPRVTRAAFAEFAPRVDVRFA